MIVLAALLIAAPAETEPAPAPAPAPSGTRETAAPPPDAPPPGRPVDEEEPPTAAAPLSKTPAKAAKTSTQPQPSPPASAEPKPSRRDRLRRDLAPAQFRVDLFVAGGTQRMADRGYRLFDEGVNPPAFTLVVRADARLGGSNVFLGGGLGYRRLATDASNLGSVQTRLVAQDMLILGRLSWSPLEGLDPFVEVATGPSFVDAHLNTTLTTHQRDVLVLCDAIGGLALSLPRKWHPSDHVTAGVELGLGYGFRSSLDVQPDPVVEDDAIATSSARFGDVRLHGFLWRAGLFLRFM
jgi:hypothetical protein